MKKLIFLSVCALLLAGCGVGVYSVSGSHADEALISFTIEGKGAVPVSVSVDGKNYELQAVANVAFKKNRDIKATAKNSIRTTPGTHEVKVFNETGEVFSKKIVVSTGEHRIVEL